MEFLTSVPIIRRLNPSLLSFIFVALIGTVASASFPLPPAHLAGEDCTGEIIRLSPCLSYVSSYPNNISSSASSVCCDSFSSAFGTGDGICFCYLLRQPLVLGFPLNATRILSLTSVCSPSYASSVTNSSLESLCNESPALPPLHSGTTSPAFTNPNASHAPAESAGPSASKSSPTKDAHSQPAPMKKPELHLFGEGYNSCRLSFSFHFVTFWMGFIHFFLWFSSR